MQGQLRSLGVKVSSRVERSLLTMIVTIIDIVYN